MAIEHEQIRKSDQAENNVVSNHLSTQGGEISQSRKQ